MKLRTWMIPLALAISALGTSATAQVVAGPPRNLTPDTISQEIWCRLGANGTKATWTNTAGVNNGTGTNQDVYISDLDGSNRQRATGTRLKGTEEYGSISPDGTKVLLHAFSSDSNSSGATDIWVYDLLTGVSNRMTTNAAYDAYPCWSPDGSKIAFMSQRAFAEGRPAKDTTVQDYMIFIMNANEPENTTTNVPVQLTNFKCTTGAKGIGFRIAFPDNSHIMFLGRQSTVSYTIGTTTTYPQEIYVCDIVDADADGMGDNMYRISDSKTAPQTSGNPSTFYDPSIAMGKVFFWSNLCADGQWHIFSMDPDGVNKNIWQVTCANGGEDYGIAQGNALIYRFNNNDTGSQGIGAANYDAAIYDLVQDDGSTTGTINATILAQGFSTKVPGILARLYNGATLLSEKLTDADGNVSFTGLRAGGYYVRFLTDPANTTSVPYSTVGRGCVVAPGATVNISAFTSPQGAPRPNGVMATIEGSQVVLQWQPNAESTNATSGFTYQGFDVYRSDNEFGPYTKITTSLIPKSANGVYRWYDTSPADLTKSFYKLTATTTSIASAPNGSQTLESTPSEFAQAANNLLFNASYETKYTDGVPTGWQRVLGTTGSDNVLGVDTTDFITGTQSQFLSAGATKSGSVWAHSQTQLVAGGPYTFYCVPTEPRAAYVSGSYSRWTGVTAVSTNNKSYTQLAYANTDPNGGIPFWYDATYNGTTIASPTTGNTSTPWMWSYQTTTAKALEFATYTRFSTCAAFDATTSVGTTARALFDDAHYQVKRVGATGIVWGRVADSTPNGVAGVTVTDGTRTTVTGPDGVFALRDVPTGNATISISYPGQTTIIETVSNIGGYRFPNDFSYSTVIPAVVGGKVTYTSGAPAAGAKVRMLVGSLTTDGEETEYVATTDANGDYTFDTTTTPVNTALKAWVVASKAGYQSTYVNNKSAAKAGKTSFNLTLGQPVRIIEVAQATTPPVIDGIVNAAEWQRSSQTPLSFMFSSTVNGSLPAVATKAYCLWDADYLYVAMVADEPNIPGLVSGWTGNDMSGSGTSIWSDDHMELFLDPVVSTAIGTGREVWQIAVNANTAGIGSGDGTQRTGPGTVMRLRSVDDVGGMNIANSVDPANNKWSIEMQIPATGLQGSYGVPVVTPLEVGQEWHGMFARYRPQGGETSSSCFVPYAASYAFSEAAAWNTLKFVQNVTQGPMKGDLNNDALVTLTDAKIALSIAAGLEDLAGRVAQGDVNDSNNAVDVRDAVRILRKVNGLDPTWP